MTRDQVANRAIANLAVALDLDPGALKLIREELTLAFTEGELHGIHRAQDTMNDDDAVAKQDDTIDRNLTARTERTRGE